MCCVQKKGGYNNPLQEVVSASVATPIPMVPQPTTPPSSAAAMARLEAEDTIPDSRDTVGQGNGDLGYQRKV